MKGNDWTVQGKTKHTQNTDESRNLKKKTKKRDSKPNRLYELFSLTVPIGNIKNSLDNIPS